jgi:hypothetical protein
LVWTARLVRVAVLAPWREASFAAWPASPGRRRPRAVPIPHAHVRVLPPKERERKKEKKWGERRCGLAGGPMWPCPWLPGQRFRTHKSQLNRLGRE